MWSKFITFLKGLWNVIKSMGNLKGVLALVITWLLISGSGLIGLGIILAIPRLAIIGTTIYGFWLLPLTPLIPINIGIAMLVQKYIFRDKNVSWENIKKQFAKVREKEEETEEEDENIFRKTERNIENNIPGLERPESSGDIQNNE